MESKDKTSKIFLFMTSKHIIQLCNFSPALVLTLPPPPCYIHFPFLLQQLRDRKLYLISTWVKTLLNSWAFWHKSQTSASPKVKLKYDREKKRRGWSKEPRVLHVWQMQVTTVELSEKVVTCVLHYSCICPSQSQSSDWFFSRLASKSVSCSIFTNGKKEGK